MSDDDSAHYNPGLNRLRGHGKTSAGYKHSKKQETRTAKGTGGYKTPGSGSKRQKGDVRIKGIARIENKCTEKKSFSITREMLDKIEEAAGATDEVPMMQIDFIDHLGKVLHSCAVVPMHVLDRIIEDARID